jgi:cytochrome c biogenesis protein CcdA
VDLAALLGLVALALVDSTSIGTLLIPLWMLLAPRLRTSRFLLYVATVAGFYFIVGVVLVLGASTIQRAFAGAGDSAAVNWAQLVIGVALFASSFLFDPKRIEKRRLRTGRPDPVVRWHERVTGDTGSPATTVTLGIAAAGLEVMTMLPYLAAVALISAAGLRAAQWLPVLLGYVLVMVAPALVLLLARAVAFSAARPAMERLGNWMAKHSAGALSWILGIVGVLLALDAAQRLGLLDFGAS